MRSTASFVGSLVLATAILSHAQVTAGVDFDVTGVIQGSGDEPQLYTEPDFLSVPATGAKDYNVTHNGITFDIKGTGTSGNQNRFRAGTNGGSFLTRDFIQWYSQGGVPEAAITLSGLVPNSEYVLSFYNYNAGAFQQDHLYYEGEVDEANFLGTFKASGNPANAGTEFIPNVDWTLNSNSAGEILVTIVASGERLTFDGMSVTFNGVAPPLEITSLEVDSESDEVAISFTGTPNTTFICLSSTDLVTFPTIETPLEGSLTTDELGVGSFVVALSDLKKFYQIAEEPIAVP